jgi:hypothetical protein
VALHIFYPVSGASVYRQINAMYLDVGDAYSRRAATIYNESIIYLQVHAYFLHPLDPTYFESANSAFNSSASFSAVA